MQNTRIDFEAGLALLKIPYSQPCHQPTTSSGTAVMFKKASVLIESNVAYAANAYETNVKR